MPEVTLAAQIEAVLFAAARPLTTAELGGLFGLPLPTIEAAMAQLGRDLSGRGVRLSHHADAWQLVTTPLASDLVKKYLGGEASSELTATALETLAIIAFRGPITKTNIEQIRGVNSDQMLRALTARGLISVSGSGKSATHPDTYEVSHMFLHQFGLESLDQLPKIAGETSED